MKKNLLFLLALICSVSLFTACSDDDNNNNNSSEEVITGPMVGTWNLADLEKEPSDFGDSTVVGGPLKLVWEAPEGVNITAMGIPMPVAMVALLTERFASPMLFSVLKDITLSSNGQILATYGEKVEGSNEIKWVESEEGYATYKKVSDELILVFLNIEKIMGSMTKADQNALTDLLQLVKDGIPVHIRYNDQKAPCFYIDLELAKKIAPLAAQFAELIPDSAMGGMASTLKGILKDLPTVLDKTTKFEVGLQMKK